MFTNVMLRKDWNESKHTLERLVTPRVVAFRNAFADSKVKAVRIEHVDVEHVDVAVMLGSAWVSRRVMLCVCIDLKNAKVCDACKAK